MSVQGSITAVDATKNADALAAAVADSIDILPALVQFLSAQDTHRRLFKLQITLRIIAMDNEDAVRLQQKITSANIQVQTNWKSPEVYIYIYTRLHMSCIHLSFK